MKLLNDYKYLHPVRGFESCTGAFLVFEHGEPKTRGAVRHPYLLQFPVRCEHLLQIGSTSFIPYVGDVQPIAVDLATSATRPAPAFGLGAAAASALLAVRVGEAAAPCAARFRLFRLRFRRFVVFAVVVAHFLGR